MAHIGDNPEGRYAKGKPIATHLYEICLERWQKSNG
jgi:hypothetical protein